jgi:ribonucleoside-diphosphate reductase alpha chain
MAEEVPMIVAKTLADNQLTHFNISVGISNEFMEAVKGGKEWELKSPLTGEVVKTVDAKELFYNIAKTAWSSGDPGVLFLDHMNRNNITPYIGQLETTNPCGEVPLFPYEACCLGSINLYNFVEGEIIDWSYLKQVVRYAVRFLDNMHDLNETPVEEINRSTRATRRIGLGVMGFADVLDEMKIQYDTDVARDLASSLAKTIQVTAWETSVELAKEKGIFPRI